MAFLYHIFTCNADSTHWTLHRSFGSMEQLLSRAYAMRLDGHGVRTYADCMLAEARRHVREAPDHSGRNFRLRDSESELHPDLRVLHWDWD